MKILITLPEKLKSGTYLANFTMMLINILSSKYPVGVLHDKRLNQKISGHLTYRFNTVVLNEWDIVIVQDAPSLLAIQAITEGTSNSIPLIFLCHDTDFTQQPFIYPYLVSIISFLPQPFPFSLPPEIVHRLDRPILELANRSMNSETFANDYQKSGEVKVIHFQQESDHDLIIARTVITALNLLLDFKLTVVADKLAITNLRHIANTNISFVQKDHFNEDDSASFDVAVTSEFTALKVLCYGRPVIIVGNRGFGGLVTTKNIVDHHKNYFRGRIGAEIGEPIPVQVLREELNFLKNNYSTIFPETSQLSVQLRDKVNPENVFQALEKHVINAVNIYNSFLSNTYDRLTPIVGRFVKYINDGNQGIVVLGGNNQVFATIDEAELEFLKKCNGSRTIKMLIQEFPNANVVEYIKELWLEKIISLKYEKSS